MRHGYNIKVVVEYYIKLILILEESSYVEKVDNRALCIYPFGW